MDPVQHIDAALAILAAGLFFGTYLAGEFVSNKAGLATFAFALLAAVASALTFTPGAL